MEIDIIDNRLNSSGAKQVTKRGSGVELSWHGITCRHPLARLLLPLFLRRDSTHFRHNELTYSHILLRRLKIMAAQRLERQDTSHRL